MKSMLLFLPVEEWRKVGNVSQQARNYVKEIALEEGHAYLPVENERKVLEVESWAVVDRYEVRTDGSVLDRLQNLVWQKDTGCHMTWPEAVEYCAHLAPQGEWKLPTIYELEQVLSKKKNPSQTNDPFQQQLHTFLPGMPRRVAPIPNTI